MQLGSYGLATASLAGSAIQPSLTLAEQAVCIVTSPKPDVNARTWVGTSKRRQIGLTQPASQPVIDGRSVVSVPANPRTVQP